MWDVVLDALFDTLKLMPFLFVLYILIELLEHETSVGKPRKALTGRWAPLVGAAFGILPMCGFSVMASKLYRHRHVTLGTLVAVLLATSDEALIVLLLSSLPWRPKLLAVGVVIVVKLVLGTVCGYLCDLFGKKRLAPLPEGHVHGAPAHAHGAETARAEEHFHAHAHEEEEYAHETGDCDCAELSPCEHRNESKFMIYFVSPFVHMMQVAAFVFLVNLAFGALFFLLGKENVIAFLRGSGYWFQPLLCVLIGVIPNCAASVVLAETFVLGGIGYGGLLAGLLAGAGLGYIALCEKGMLRRGLCILGGIALFSAAAGYAICALTLLI